MPRNKGGKFLNNLWFCVFQIPAVLTSAFHSTNLFLFSLHERLKLGRQLLNFSRWTIYVVNSVENTYPFSIFLFVPGKIYSEVIDNWKYFCCFHAPGRYKKNISDFLKASHTLWVDISRTFWPIFMKIQEICKHHKFI